MKKILSLLLLVSILTGCQPKEKEINLAELNPQNDTYYHLFVRSFADSDGDGVGDINGITENLDYLEDLGITGIWLMPINPSPSYHGYSVTNYYDIDPEYGTLEDFQNLIDTANEKGITIMIDLVINHTSDQHPWYVDARSSSNSPYRDYYIWQGSTAFSSFVGGMVDLNLDNEGVKTEIKNIFDFYLDMGVRGFRLDAVKHFFEKPGVTAVTLKNTFFLLEMNAYIKETYPDSFITAEVWETNHEFNVDYFIGTDSILDFTIAGIIQNRIGVGTNTYQLASSIKRVLDDYRAVNPNFVASPFITNHDLDRIASMSGFNGAQGLERMKLAANVLLTLPGSPFIYYGDEIGMKGVRYEGTNIPGYGVVYDEYRRQPLLWGNPAIQTTWLPSDGSNNNTADIPTQLANPNSLLNQYKTMIQLRNTHPALAYGNYFEPFKDNQGALQGYVRYYQYDNIEEAVLVIHNLATTTRILDIPHESILYGSLELGAFQTVILKINPSQIGDYI